VEVGKGAYALDNCVRLIVANIRLPSPPPADEGYTPETFVFFISLGYQTILPPGSLFKKSFIIDDWRTVECYNVDPLFLFLNNSQCPSTDFGFKKTIFHIPTTTTKK
jgi:hypothetical protein